MRAAVASPHPLARLRAVAVICERLSEIERAAVLAALDLGRTWGAIGERLGISRQAVHRRHGPATPDLPRRTRRRRRVEARWERAREEALVAQVWDEWERRRRGDS